MRKGMMYWAPTLLVRCLGLCSGPQSFLMSIRAGPSSHTSPPCSTIVLVPQLGWVTGSLSRQLCRGAFGNDLAKGRVGPGRLKLMGP